MSHPSDTPSRKLDTRLRREQIARVALQQVIRDGVSGLNLGRVAADLGLVPSAIYRHFPSKEAVLDAVLDLIHDRLLGNVRQVRRETADPVAQLRRLLMLHLEMVRQNEGIPRVIFSEETILHPGRKAKVYATIRLYLQRVEEIVRLGQQQGRIRENLDPPVIAIMFLGLIQPAVILHQLGEGDFDLLRQAEAGWQIFHATLTGGEEENG